MLPEGGSLGKIGLTPGLVTAAMRSLAAQQRRLETPHLAVRYQVTWESLFWQS